MGHNLTDRKARELDAAERSRLVSGWTVTKDGRVEQPQTPAAVRARGAHLEARCGKREDCKRRVTFDAVLWCERGMGLLPLSEVLAAYRCSLIPCRLDWRPESYPQGSPLGAVLYDPGATVTVSCACGRLKPQTFPIKSFAEFVARADPRNLAIPANRLPSSLVRGVCPWCRERQWRFGVHRTPHRSP